MFIHIRGLEYFVPPLICTPDLEIPHHAPFAALMFFILTFMWS